MGELSQFNPFELVAWHMQSGNQCAHHLFPSLSRSGMLCPCLCGLNLVKFPHRGFKAKEEKTLKRDESAVCGDPPQQRGMAVFEKQPSPGQTLLGNVRLLQGEASSLSLSLLVTASVPHS